MMPDAKTHGAFYCQLTARDQDSDCRRRPQLGTCGNGRLANQVHEADRDTNLYPIRRHVMRRRETAGVSADYERGRRRRPHEGRDHIRIGVDLGTGLWGVQLFGPAI